MKKVMSAKQQEYLSKVNEMLSQLEQYNPEIPYQIDSGSKILDWNHFLDSHKKQINSDEVFSKGWNATASRIKTILEKIKNNG